LGGSELDVALLSLSSAVGDTLGWMGMDFSFSSGYANVTGHPGLYSNYMTNDFGFVSQYYIDQTIDISNLDINPGNSGGPIWYNSGNGPYVVGVVSTGIAASSLSPYAEWLMDIIKDNDRFITDSIKYGTNGNDIFAADSSVQTFVGYDGTDTVTFSGSRAQFGVSVDHSGNGSVENSSTHTVWSLSSIERVSFFDGALAFDIEGNAGQAYRLYQAAFDRIPDVEGLSYWIGRLDSNTTSLNAVADSFIQSQEFVSTYGTTETVGNASYVELLYNHTLGRVSDQEGFNYWVNTLDTQQTDRGDLLAFFSESDENFARTEPAIHDGIWFFA
jgi:hypothetical protein